MTDEISQTLPQHWAAKFFTIWTGQAFSLVGSALVQFALVWWLTQKTGSATILATVTLVALLPQIVLGPFVGTLVDRWNRRWIMVVADSVIALATAVLMVLFATGRIQVWHIYAISLIRSLGGAFHHPAMSSSTSLMVPNKHLARVAGANQLLQGIVTIFAPPLGALLISIFPTQAVLAIDVVTAIVAVIPLLFIAIPQPPHLCGSGEWNCPKNILLAGFAGWSHVCGQVARVAGDHSPGNGTQFPAQPKFVTTTLVDHERLWQGSPGFGLGGVSVWCGHHPGGDPAELLGWNSSAEL